MDSQSPNRTELVKKFQNEIWIDEEIQDEKLSEILSELAYDLDYYEPNETRKKESPNYYDDERLDELIKLGVHRIEDYKKAAQ